MDIRVKQKMEKILKVIKMFSGQYDTYLLKTVDIYFEKGKPIKQVDKIKVNLTVMKQEQRWFIRDTVATTVNKYGDNFEVFYTYDNKDIKEFKTNDIILINEGTYRVSSVENNYELFQRLEVVKYDRKVEE